MDMPTQASGPFKVSPDVARGSVLGSSKLVIVKVDPL